LYLAVSPTVYAPTFVNEPISWNQLDSRITCVTVSTCNFPDHTYEVIFVSICEMEFGVANRSIYARLAFFGGIEAIDYFNFHAIQREPL
jgi:hypothetical protein